MFGFFKKKDIPQKPDPRETQVQEFAQRFEPEEITILAVTGPVGFAGVRTGDDELWTAGMELTAWMEEDGEEIHRESARLVTLCDDRLLDYLRQRAPRDFVIKVKARRSVEGNEFQLIGLPEPGFDPDLKAILEEQKKPVSRYIEGLGTFTLNRTVGWFEANVDWLGTEIALNFDQDENLADCVLNAKKLMEDQKRWDDRVRAFAAGELLELANDWAQEDADGETAEVTRERFIARMELESIQVYEDGGFEFWFGDGDLFWGHSIHVSGSLEDGPTDAQMEG